jgi:hypothetical protein
VSSSLVKVATGIQALGFKEDAHIDGIWVQHRPYVDSFSPTTQFCPALLLMSDLNSRMPTFTLAIPTTGRQSSSTWKENVGL